jgi:hypothetical protein
MEEEHPGWNAAHGFTLPERKENAAMRWGTAFENALATLAARHTGGRVTKREKQYTDSLSPCGAQLSCHIDGMIRGKLYEAKTTSSFSYRNSWGALCIPDYYQAQVQHNLMLTGLSEAVVVCLEFPKAPEEWEQEGWYVINYGPKWWLQNALREISDVEPLAWARTLYEMGYFHRYEIAADKQRQQAMKDSYAEFWEHIKAETPPEPENYEDLKRIFPEPKGTLVVPQEMKTKIAMYRSIGEEIGTGGALAKHRERLKVEILSWARKQSTVLDDESTEALILRDECGNKCGSFSRTKTGTLMFRA